MALFALNFGCFTSVNLLVSTLPPHLAAIGHEESSVGAIFGAFFLSCVAARLVAARLTSRLGPVGAVRLAMAVSALGNILFMAAGGIFGRLVARLVFGAGFGLTTTLLVSMAARILPPQRLAEGLGFLNIAPPLSLAAAPLIALLIAGAWGFATLQVVVVAVCLAGLAASFYLDPRSFPAPPTKGGPIFSAAPLPAAMLAFLLGSANTAIFSFLALYLVELGSPGTGAFFLMATISMVSTRIFAGRLYDRHGHFWVVIPSVALIESAFLMLLAIQGGFEAALAGLVFGLGMGALFPTLQVLAISSVPDSGKTMAAGMALNGNDLGMFLNTVLMGAVAGLAGTFSTVFKVSAVLPCLIFLVYGLHPAFRRQRSQDRSR